MEKLKVLFGFSVEEDPLKREIEEMRRAAKAAMKEAERREKQAAKANRKGGSQSGGEKERSGWRFFSKIDRNPKNEESRGLSKAVEELESIFAEVFEQL